jgi:hypothetical protein
MGGFYCFFVGGLWVNFLVGFVNGTWMRFRVVLWKYCAKLAMSSDAPPSSFMNSKVSLN